MAQDKKRRVFGAPAKKFLGKPLPRSQRILLGLLCAVAGTGMFALVLWTLEKIYFPDGV